MPMLDAFGDGDTLSREQFLRLFTPDLVIALPCRSQKDLAGPMVDVPMCAGAAAMDELYEQYRQVLAGAVIKSHGGRHRPYA